MMAVEKEEKTMTIADLTLLTTALVRLATAVMKLIKAMRRRQ
jgi:hypothetical protein